MNFIRILPGDKEMCIRDRSIGNAMRRGAKGIKIMCSGRLGGAEIARSEQYLSLIHI